MSNARLFWRFASDAADTISASQSDYQLGVERLQESSPSTLWQDTTAAASVTITLDLGSAVACSAFCLLNHNFDDTESSVQLVASATEGGLATPSFTQAITYRADNFIECFSEQSYQWWQFQYTKASAGDVRNAGRLILGPYYELPRNVSKGGFSWGWKDLSAKSVTRGGVSHADIAAKLRTMSMTTSLTSEAQTDEFNSLAQSYGRHTPFAFLGDHDNNPTDWFVYGTLSNLTAQEYERYDGVGHQWTVSMAMEEAK
jgi:hypothetical protein